MQMGRISHPRHRHYRFASHSVVLYSSTTASLTTIARISNLWIRLNYKLHLILKKASKQANKQTKNKKCLVR